MSTDRLHSQKHPDVSETETKAYRSFRQALARVFEAKARVNSVIEDDDDAKGYAADEALLDAIEHLMRIPAKAGWQVGAKVEIIQKEIIAGGFIDRREVGWLTYVRCDLEQPMALGRKKPAY